jgi:GxxExxY protein
MSISCPVTIRRLTAEEFKDMDYRVMRHAFATQNELGRLCDEHIYQKDLAARLAADGFGRVRCEVPVTVIHDSFRKVYYLDLLVADAALYELKATSALVNDDLNQILNYLFLLDQPRGKLINFRPHSVETQFANTTLQSVDRYEYQMITDRWEETEDRSRLLRRLLVELLADWGAFLNFTLYLEAVTHFLGGESEVVRLIPISRDGLLLGKQRFHHLDNRTGFRITAFTEAPTKVESHLVRLLEHTPLQIIQWVNFNHHRIEMTTLRRS